MDQFTLYKIVIDVYEDALADRPGATGAELLADIKLAWARRLAGEPMRPCAQCGFPVRAVEGKRARHVLNDGTDAPASCQAASFARVGHGDGMQEERRAR